MKFYVAISCLLAASVSADGGLGLGGLGGLDGLSVYAPGHASADYYAYPKYAFEYAVKDPHTGDNKAQWEKRDGDVVKGAYSLVEPDGSVRVVEYWADDKSGFNAVVKRLGPNLHPTGVPVAPIYKAPIPVLSGLSGHAAPISIGPIAKYEGLSAAPLWSGPIGGAVSSAALYKSAPIVVPTPILPAPIIKAAPIYSAPQPIHAPVIPAPIYKSGPILPVSYLPSPYLKSGPILSAPLDYSLGGGYGKGLGDLGLGGIGKGLPIAPLGDLGLGKGSLGALEYGNGLYGKGLLGAPLADLGHGLSGPILSGWGAPLSYSNHGLKH